MAAKPEGTQGSFTLRDELPGQVENIVQSVGVAIQRYEQYMRFPVKERAVSNRSNWKNPFHLSEIPSPMSRKKIEKIQ